MSSPCECRSRRALRALILGITMAGLALPVSGRSDTSSATPAPTAPEAITRRRQEGEPPLAADATGQLTRKQRQNFLKANFEKMKKDADELAELAKSLQDDLNKSSENVLSLQIVEKADKIEKLAKKIKGTAKGS